MESDAVQPCNLYLGEPEIRGPAGTAAGTGHKKERGKKKGKKERQKERKE